jgi:hypothetical protein
MLATFIRAEGDSRWSEYDSSLVIDRRGDNVRVIIAKSKLVVHSYDSTGILEAMCQNIPTITFWKNRFDHLRDSAKPYCQMF